MTIKDWIELIAILSELIVTIYCVKALVYYRLHKKHKQDSKQKLGIWAGFYNLIDKNIVEFTLFAVLIPDWTLLVKLFS